MTLKCCLNSPCNLPINSFPFAVISTNFCRRSPFKACRRTKPTPSKRSTNPVVADVACPIRFANTPIGTPDSTAKKPNKVNCGIESRLAEV